LSEQPSTRRDLALLVPDELPAATLLEQITNLGLDALIEVRLFDIYRSAALGARKSVALGLIFQDISRTLTDQQVDDLVARVLERVRESCHAELRT
jgi:Phenylalanyl-tRNA synthetase beta subunit